MSTIFFELKKFGHSSINTDFKLDYKSAAVPTDNSIDMLLSLFIEKDPIKYEYKIEQFIKSGSMFINEINLAKILYLWKFQNHKSKFCSKLITDFSHNKSFSRFLEIRTQND